MDFFRVFSDYSIFGFSPQRITRNNYYSYYLLGLDWNMVYKNVSRTISIVLKAMTKPAPLNIPI